MGSITRNLLGWTMLFAAAAYAIDLRGRVRDARTGEPLARVRVHVAGTGQTTVTGPGGVFVLDPVPAGPVKLQISAPTYALLKYDVPETRAAELDILLQPDADSVITSVSITAGVFDGPDSQTAPSEHTLNKAELQSLGTSVIGDPLRSVQALPSVTTNNDGRGEVSVRGSSFDRVGLMVDGVLLDGFLHQISSDALGSDRDRASFSIVTPDRIAEVSLLNAAFPATHGLRTAGLVQLRTRDGNRERRDTRISTGITLGTSLVHDGPFAGKRGSYLLGVRSSALNPLNSGTEDQTFRFEDGQIKLLYDLSPRHRLGLNTLLGGFRYEDRKTALTDGRNTTTQANSASVAVLANWDWTLSSRALVATKLFHTEVGLNGLNREGILLGRLPRRQWGGRQDWTVQTGSEGRIQFGTYLRSVSGQADGFVFIGPSQQTKLLAETFRGSTTEGNYYAQTSQRLLPHLTLTLGARAETNRLTKENYVSPRAALAWTPNDSRFALRAGYGRHRQFAELSDLLSLFGNPALRAEVTDHYTAGADVRLGERSRLRAEVFERRDYRQIFRLNEPRWLAGRVFQPDAPSLNSVSGHARGVEVMLQRRSGNRFSGWASYAFLNTRLKERTSGLRFPTDFDQRHTVSLFGLYRLSETWNLNAIYRTASGVPFTGFLRREADGRYFLATDRNALRLRSYGRLDVRLNKTLAWRATRWSLVLEGINVLNQGNVTFNGIERYDLRSGQILNPVTQYGFTRTATAGLTVQF